MMIYDFYFNETMGCWRHQRIKDKADPIWCDSTEI